MNMFQKLLDFLNRLDEVGLVYTLEHNRDETIMVTVSKENERWEVEFVADGDIDVEVFYSENDDLEDEDALERLFDDSDGDDSEDDDDFDGEEFDDVVDEVVEETEDD